MCKQTDLAVVTMAQSHPAMTAPNDNKEDIFACFKGYD